MFLIFNRTPLSIREHRYKFMQDNNFFHKQDSIISEEQADIKIPSIQYQDVNVTRLSVSESSLETNNYFPNISDKDIDEHSCDVNNKSYEMNKTFIKCNITTVEMHKKTTEPYKDEQRVPEEQLLSSKKYVNATQDDDNNRFLMYLPIEILKSVHQNLKSQPETTEGKLKFLKSFEKILSHEIGEYKYSF